MISLFSIFREIDSDGEAYPSKKHPSSEDDDNGGGDDEFASKSDPEDNDFMQKPLSQNEKMV